MSGSKKLTLRVQSSEGTSRIEILDTDNTAKLYERVYETLNLNTYTFALHKDRSHKEEIISSKSGLVRDYGLHHGDMLYLSPVNGAVLFDQQSTSTESLKPALAAEAGPSTSSMSTPSSSGLRKKNVPQEDEVDLQLYQMSGNIQRQRDDKLCRHNSKGCCVHCTPLEPWDENYLKEHNIKHLSFHSYLRKMTSGKFISLDELSCKIKPGCKEHPPWPRGICSTCQPGAVTLNRQPYRHVDNVLLEHAAPVDRFLAYWRITEHQRIAFLYGKYERHPDVPLGIRARVAALYEPPQQCTRDSIVLAEDEKGPILNEIAARLGLTCVGWMFTDLLPLDLAAGTVKKVRGMDTHFLSAQECIMAAHYQNKHPNACRHASSGYFGSKFVTVCVTGDSNNQIHLEGYQVSGQCAALVRDDILVPTRDAPDLGYIRDCTTSQYVPDVYYKERDVYGNEVGVSAKRLPVAYLLVDVPCGVAPSSSQPTFSPAATFPPANRPLQNQIQSLKGLHDHIQRSSSFLEAMSDIHVLLYLATNEALPLTLEQLEPLLDAVRTRDEQAADACRADSHVATLLQLALACEHDMQASSVGPGDGSQDVWTCQVCTYHNAAPLDSCEMCAMPRNNGL
ncbi:nuclear protein localization protein 4 homolog [Leptidea sinapis]|uniref:nuclear protein localization protein 4 homolog n=1 Tax=Leptidea sinapis TaxID=189913 RepID=UPI00212EBBF9|nr:nuclear protein localization protein 4 homolog [Leptidea sinapis]